MRRAFGAGTAIAFLAIAAVAMAQPWQGWKNCGGWCSNKEGGAGGYGRVYDTARIETVSGEVTAVEQITPRRGMGQGIGLKLKTATATLFVHLGPQWYIERQGELPIKAGDAVEVKGVKAVRMGEDIFIAGEVKKGSEVLKLRDEQGIPMWAGWRRSSSTP